MTWNWCWGDTLESQSGGRWKTSWIIMVLFWGYLGGSEALWKWGLCEKTDVLESSFCWVFEMGNKERNWKKKVNMGSVFGVRGLTVLFSKHVSLLSDQFQICAEIYRFIYFSNVSTCPAYPSERSWISLAKRLKWFVNYTTTEQMWEIMPQAGWMQWKQELVGGHGDGWLGVLLSQW